jgi:integrase
MTKPIKGGGAMSPATVRKTFRVVQGVLRSAEEEELIARNPCPGIDLPKVGPKPEIVFLTVDQVDDLAECHPGRYQALVRLGAFGGLRASELAGLKESRLHFPQHNVVVAETLTEVRGHLINGTPKSGRARIVHLEDDMLEELARHVSMYPPTRQGNVFSSPTGMPIRHRNYYERVFLPACRKAGLPMDTEFKSLRHTYAAMAISRGTNIYQVQQQMGHSSVDVTGNIYGHLYHQDLEAYRERLLAFRRQAKAKRIERRGLSIVS